MTACYTSPTGLTLTVWLTEYMDYGLSITRGGALLYSHPHRLGLEDCGRRLNPLFFGDEEDEDEHTVEDVPIPAGHSRWVPWTRAEWRAYLVAEAANLMDAYLSSEQLEAIEAPAGEGKLP